VGGRGAHLERGLAGGVARGEGLAAYVSASHRTNLGVTSGRDPNAAAPGCVAVDSTMRLVRCGSEWNSLSSNAASLRPDVPTWMYAGARIRCAAASVGPRSTGEVH